jgi:hypothetical protein
MDKKPQLEQKHPDQWQQDLNPEHLAGQNIGEQASGTAQQGNTAYSLRELHRQLSDFHDDELKQIPVLPTGARLQQGATYLDLNNRSRGEFTATGEMEAGSGNAYVPKSQTPYPIWNRLLGIDDPDRL